MNQIHQHSRYNSSNHPTLTTHESKNDKNDWYVLCALLYVYILKKYNNKKQNNTQTEPPSLTSINGPTQPCTYNEIHTTRNVIINVCYIYIKTD